ncbi:MAG: thiamine diphosphokinase [Victivallales bacterium]|nr:thiamine diphosphokinase [Victivallales bacterium]
MQNTTVILANGTFPTAPQALAVLDGAARIVCCDGAAIALMESGRTPAAVIGDLDSISPELRRKLAPMIVHVTEQDTNDLNKAFRYCLAQGWTDIVILGATGKREDHTLGNISLLVDFAQKIPGIKMVTDDGVFEVMLESGSCEARVGQQISIFAMEPDTPIESHNLKYPLNGLAPSRWWQATLNESLADTFTLTFPTNHPLLIYKAF